MPSEQRPNRGTTRGEGETTSHPSGGDAAHRRTSGGSRAGQHSGREAKGVANSPPAGAAGGSKGDKVGGGWSERKAGVDSDDREQLERLGRRIRQLRLARGYTSQLAFTLEAKLPRGSYSDIERGQRNPTISTLNNIARALKVELSDLFVSSPSHSEEVDTPAAPGAQALGAGAVGGEAEKSTSRWHEHTAVSSATESNTTEAFPFRQAQALFRSTHRRLGEPPLEKQGRDEQVHALGSTSGASASEGGGAAEGPVKGPVEATMEAAQTEGAQAGEAEGTRTAGRHKMRGGTLVSTAYVARAFGVNLRTIERWVDANKLLPWDWVDQRLVVFRREEIEALAREYREYLSLKNQISSTATAVDATVQIEASKALKRLLKRYKRKRRAPGGGPVARSHQAGHADEREQS